MGNCLAPSKKRCQVHELEEERDLPAVINDNFDNTMEKPEKTGEIGGVDGGSGGGMKVKIVLTKEELDWLIYELKGKKNGSNNGGGSTKKLEDALAEIQRNRALKSVDNNCGNCWQPSLESITETPEDVGSGRYY